MENSKLREALRAALEQVNKVYDILSRPCVVIEEARQGCREARGVLIPALAEPVKNCEVGTSDEQALRFVEFCGKHHTAQGRWICHECPCKGNMNEIQHCLTKWAQMPCEAVE